MTSTNMPDNRLFSNKVRLADLGLFYSAAIWGSTFFIVKGALEAIDPIMLVAYRFLLAAVIMLPIIIRLKLSPLSDFGSGLALGLPLWILYIFQTVGLKYTSAANSGFITGLFVVFVPVFQIVFRGILPKPLSLTAVFVSLSGLWVLSGGLKYVNRGDFLTLAAAMAYAAHILITDRKIDAGINPYVLNFQQFAIVGGLSFFGGFLKVGQFAFPYRTAGAAIAFLAIFPTLSAFLVQLLAQKHVSPIRVSLIFAFEPVFAGLFAWTLGGESFTFRQASGGLLIFAGMIISGSAGDFKAERNQ